jgi:hypothetical protein
MWIKFLIVILFIAILGSLFSALFFLYKDRYLGERTVRALTVRIGLSILLFAILMIGFWTGLIPARS